MMNDCCNDVPTPPPPPPPDREKVPIAKVQSKFVAVVVNVAPIEPPPEMRYALIPTSGEPDVRSCGRAAVGDPEIPPENELLTVPVPREPLLPIPAITTSPLDVDMLDVATDVPL